MAYIRYDVNVTPVVYQDYERLRKDYAGKRLTRQDASTIIGLCGLPADSPKMFELAMKYEILLKGGKARGTYYTVPKEQVPYARFEGLEHDFYNGSKPKAKEPETPKVTERETNRTVLDEDYCLRYLKERGYMCFKLRPNLQKMQQVLTPQFLLENCDAEVM